jgi:hypothetical protein
MFEDQCVAALLATRDQPLDGGRLADGCDEVEERLVAMIGGHKRPMTLPSSTLSAANRVVAPDSAGSEIRP